MDQGNQTMYSVIKVTIMHIFEALALTLSTLGDATGEVTVSGGSSDTKESAWILTSLARRSVF